MPIITITRGKFSGGEEIAEDLAKQLGAKCISDELLRESAKDYKADEAVMADFFEKNPNFVDRMTSRRFEYVAFLRATLLGMCEDNNLVYHGNAGQELLRDVPHALKVRLMLSFHFRARRLMEQFDIPFEQAEEMVRQIDDDRTKRTQYYYDADWRDSSRYDLMIRMDGTKRPFIENTIKQMVEQPRFQPTEEDLEAFHKVHFLSKLQAIAAAMLGAHISMMNLTYEDHVVTLEGSFPTSDVMKLDQLLDQLRALDEVHEVVPKISAGFAFYR